MFFEFFFKGYCFKQRFKNNFFEDLYMLSENVRKNLEKQKYAVVGQHSAVKTCGWTSKDIKNEGSCYKGKFYGISSHECMQVTPNLACANRCTFCWRDMRTPIVRDDWKWEVDPPQKIFDDFITAHRKNLIGYKGNPKADPEKYEKSKYPKHVALSLSGEPIKYPYINELIDLFHQNRITTFLVTNGQHPDRVRDLRPVTQLYISIDAPNKELLKEIDKPAFPDFWERLNESLGYLAQKKHHTTIRITLIKDMNMEDLDGWKKLIEKGDPDFIEVKGYMWIGSSQARLDKKNMPYMDEIRKFSNDLAEVLDSYTVVNEQEASNVVLLSKNKDTKIDFEEFFDKFANAEKLEIKKPKLKVPISV